MINPTNLSLFLDTVGAFDVNLFMHGLLWFIATMVAWGTQGWFMFALYEHCATEDAKDYYQALADGLEEYEALSVVDSLYHALSMQVTGPAFVVPPHIASLPSMEELMEVPEPRNLCVIMMEEEPCCHLDGAGCFCDEAEEPTEELELEYQEYTECLTDEEFEEDFEDVELDELWARTVLALDEEQPEVEYNHDSPKTKIMAANLLLASLA